MQITIKKPIGHTVIIRTPKEEVVSEGGIILPQKVMKHNSREAEVVNVGPDVLEVVPGDTIHYVSAATRAFNSDDDYDYFYVREGDILAKIG